VNSTAKPKIVVTGADGFIGKAVLSNLAKRGFDAVAVIRDGSKGSTSHESNNAVEMDLASAGKDIYAKLGNPDILIHLAWGGLPNYMSTLHFEIELPYQYRFLKNMIEGGLKHLLVAGTCFEYGMQNGGLSETAPALPSNSYALAKDTLRKQLQILKSQNTFSFAWTRLFYIYGNGQTTGSIYSQLMEAIQCGESSFKMSLGEQIRDYLPIEEVADILVSLALSREDLGIVNVCSGRPISLRRQVENWLSAKNATIKLELGHYPYLAHEPFAFWGIRDRLDAFLARQAGNPKGRINEFQ
jgi:nucleoside-diphosphate-sugar epimerase